MSLYPKCFLRLCYKCVPNFMLVSSKAQNSQNISHICRTNSHLLHCKIRCDAVPNQSWPDYRVSMCSCILALQHGQLSSLSFCRWTTVPGNVWSLSIYNSHIRAQYQWSASRIAFDAFMEKFSVTSLDSLIINYSIPCTLRGKHSI